MLLLLLLSETPLAPFWGWITSIGGQVEPTTQCMSHEVQDAGLGMHRATCLVQETR